MDIETQTSMRYAVIGAAISFGISLIAYCIMVTLLPHYLSGGDMYLADYSSFLRILIMANIIQFVMLPVLLTFFINDAGELENFTKTGLIENAWKVNVLGVFIILVGAGIMGWAMASMFPGWGIVGDPNAVYGNAIKLMNASMLIQSLGFGMPVFYFLLSKYMARDEIPFTKMEIRADLIGIVFSVIMFVPAVIMTVSAIAFPIAGVFGIISTIVGIFWCMLLFIALKQRDLPDVPED
ncbi:MAG: hypothetical protein ACFFCS_16360 [Candidatus Hodarchaeota archaeon]